MIHYKFRSSTDIHSIPVEPNATGIPVERFRYFLYKNHGFSIEETFLRLLEPTYEEEYTPPEVIAKHSLVIIERTTTDNRITSENRIVICKKSCANEQSAPDMASIPSAPDTASSPSGWCNNTGHFPEVCPSNVNPWDVEENLSPPVLPDWYWCHRCGIKGHYLRNCPDNMLESNKKVVPDHDC